LIKIIKKATPSQKGKEGIYPAKQINFESGRNLLPKDREASRISYQGRYSGLI